MNETEFMFVCRHIHKANTVEPSHSHSCHELVYYVSGKGECKIGDNTFSYCDNQILYIPPYKKHIETHFTQTEVLFFGFELRNSEFMISEGIYNDDAKRRLLRLFEGINDEILNRKPMYQYAANLKIGNVLLLLHRQIKKLNGKRDVVEDCLEFAENYIKMHIQQKINVFDLAKSVGYSYDYFRHEFLGRYGLAPKTYILNEKISHVKKRLRETDDSVAQIAERYAFDSPSHCTRVFKNIVGCSPTQYRAQNTVLTNDIDVKYEDRK